jgi:hypothetical protein
MNKSAFSDFVKSLALHFGQEKYVEPGQQTKMRLTSWFDQVKDLPSESLGWMAGQIKRNNEFFPRNLSKTMLELWPGWKSENPDKLLPINQQCRDCHDCLDGVLYAWTWRDNRLLTAAFRCSCGKAANDFPAMPMTCKADLETNGWIVEAVAFSSHDDQDRGGVDFRAVI